MEQSGATSSSNKGAIPKNYPSSSHNSSTIQCNQRCSTEARLDSGYPLEAKPAIQCIPPSRMSSNVMHTRSLSTINPNKSVKVEIVYKSDQNSSDIEGSSMSVIYINTKSKSEHIQK